MTVFSFIDNIIESKKLSAEEKINLENCRDELREMLRIEVDERIPKEVAKAIEKRDADAAEELMRKHVRSVRDVALKNIEAIV